MIERDNFRLIAEFALGAIGCLVPAANRKYNSMRAVDSFNAHLPEAFITRRLAGPGYDPEGDNGYKEVLKLAGGKAEFDAYMAQRLPA